MTAKTDWIDKRADVAALLSHPVRKQIRDLLRHSDPLTLTEIARSIGHSEPNTHHHLSRMLEANIVVKKPVKINGRLVTLYSLSEYYDELFGETEQKPDILPVYALFAVYTVMTVLTLMFPAQLLAFYSIFKIKSIQIALMMNIVGLITSAVILMYYLVPELLKHFRGEK